MKRYSFFILIFLMLLLSGCNLPQSNPTPTVNLVGTQVSQVLTAQPTSTTVPTTAPIEPTNTVIVVTPTESGIPPSTPTPVATDPRQILGDPTWQDSMNNGNNWGLGSDGYKDDYIEIEIEDGFMKLEAERAAGWLSWRLGGAQLQNGYVEATFKTGNCSGNDIYGIVLRAPDYESGLGYYLQLTCDGRYNLSVWKDSGLDALQEWTTSSAILAGSNQTNRLGAWITGNQWKLYVNGVLIKEISDGSLTNMGHIGFFIIANQTPDFTIYVDEIATWE